MRTIWRIYCTLILALVLSGVSLVPVAAHTADSPLIDTTADLTVPNEYGITIRPLPDSPGGTTAVTSTTGKNSDPVVNAAVAKMQAGGMELTNTHTRQYEIAIPDASLERIQAESGALSAGIGSDIPSRLQAEHPEEFAQLAASSASTQQNTRKENGKTISRMEVTSVTFTNEKTRETRDAAIVQNLDDDGNVVGAVQIFSDPAHYTDAAVLAAQPDTSEEQKTLLHKYYWSCVGWKALFWFLIAFIAAVVIAAIIATIVLCNQIIFVIGVSIKMTVFAWGPVGALAFFANFFPYVFVSMNLLKVLAVLGIAGGAIANGATGLPGMFRTMKETCTQKEEYGASRYDPDPTAEGALPASMRPDWNLLDNHRAVAWQNYAGPGTLYSGIQSLSDGGYIASGYGADSTGMKGLVVNMDSFGSIVKSTVIGNDNITIASDVQVAPDGSAYVFGMTESSSGNGIGDRTGSGPEGLVVKIDQSGTVLWSRTLGETGNDYGFASGTFGTDGTIYAAGSEVFVNLSTRGFVAALNPDGTDHPVPAWDNKSFALIAHSTDSTSDKFTRIQSTRDNGLILAGSTIPAGTRESKGWLLKLNPDGSRAWSSTAGSDNAAFSGVAETTAGGFVTSGSSIENFWDGGLFSGDRTKLGPAGFVISWSPDGQKTGEMEFKNLMDVSIANIQPAADGGYVVSGLGRINGGPIAGAHGGLDGWVAKLRPDLSIEWQKTLGGKNNEEFLNAIEAPDGDIVAVGYTKSGDYDLAGRTVPADESASGWIVALRYDAGKAPDRMDTWLDN